MNETNVSPTAELTFVSGWKKLIYMPDGQFSITRISMLVASLTCLIVAWISIVIGLYGIEVPATILKYLLAVSGGSMVQYTYTKYNTPEHTVAVYDYKMPTNAFHKAIHKLIYMPDGSLSATRIVMILSLLTAGVIVWIGLSAYLLPLLIGTKPILIPDSCYNYISALCGAGMLQYIGGKQISAKSTKEPEGGGE